MTGLIFEVTKKASGGFVAFCASAGIRTAGANLAELHANITGALDAHYSGRGGPPHPSKVRLLVSEE